MPSLLKRNINIDLIKILACVGVVGLHSVGMSNYTLYYFCTFAVPMFYMVNGYLMFSKKDITWSYSFKKILSYLRLIFFWNIIIMLPVMILRHKIINPITECIRSVMQQGYLWHFWFFGMMLLLLLVLPVLHKLLHGHAIRHILSVVVLFIACITFTAYSWISEFPMQAFVPQCLRIWTALLYFLFGGLLSSISIEKIRSKLVANGKIFQRLFLFFELIIFLMLTYVTNMGQKHLGNFVYHNRTAEFFYDEATVILWCFFMFFVLLTLPISGASDDSKIMRTEMAIGKISKLTLGIFIIHPLVLKALDTLIEKIIITAPDNALILILKTIFVTLVSGIATWIILKIKYLRKLVEL